MANLRAVSGAIFKQLAPFPLKKDLIVPSAAIFLTPCEIVILEDSWTWKSILSRSTGAVEVLLTTPAIAPENKSL